jgi:23S rRNA U2552 (ribose-2'-O)-methylase RlmE/FtsJ
MRRLFFFATFLAFPSFASAADVVPYLPAETNAVLTVQVRDVADSELGKKVGAELLKELLGASKQAATAVEATGLDLLKDFDVITVGIDLDKIDPPKPFALFEGKFDAKKVETSIAAFMKDHPDRVSAITVGGKSAYKVPGGKPTETMYAAILDDAKLVVAGTEKDLGGALAAAAGNRKPAISKELAGLLATAKSTAPIFARAWVKGKLGELKLPNEKLNAQVQKVDWATAAITVNKDVAITLTVNAPDEASAKVLSDLLGAVVGLIRLQIAAAAEDQPELMPIRDLLRATKVAPVGKTVIATGSVKGEAIEKALHPPEAKKEEPKKK